MKRVLGLSLFFCFLASFNLLASIVGSAETWRRTGAINHLIGDDAVLDFASQKRSCCLHAAGPQHWRVLSRILSSCRHTWHQALGSLCSTQGATRPDQICHFYRHQNLAQQAKVSSLVCSARQAELNSVFATQLLGNLTWRISFLF